MSFSIQLYRWMDLNSYCPCQKRSPSIYSLLAFALVLFLSPSLAIASPFNSSSSIDDRTAVQTNDHAFSASTILTNVSPLFPSDLSQVPSLSSDTSSSNSLPPVNSKSSFQSNSPPLSRSHSTSSEESFQSANEIFEDLESENDQDENQVMDLDLDVSSKNIPLTQLPPSDSSPHPSPLDSTHSSSLHSKSTLNPSHMAQSNDNPSKPKGNSKDQKKKLLTDSSILDGQLNKSPSLRDGMYLQLNSAIDSSIKHFEPFLHHEIQIVVQLAIEKT